MKQNFPSESAFCLVKRVMTPDEHLQVYRNVIFRHENPCISKRHFPVLVLINGQKPPKLYNCLVLLETPGKMESRLELIKQALFQIAQLSLLMQLTSVKQ